MTMSASARLEDIVFGPEPGRRVLFVHGALAALIGLRVALGSYRQLADTPGPLFDPVPLLGWMPSMPPAWVILTIQVIGTVAAVAAVARRHPRVAFGLAWACYLVLAGIRGSRGKVLHNDLLLLWSAVPFLLAPVELAWRDRTPRRDQGWPLRAAQVIAALIYWFAGYHKLRRSGISWAVGDNVKYVMLWGPSVGAAMWDGLADWVAANGWAYRFTGILILACELTFPVVLVKRGWQPIWAAVAVALHVGTYLMLGLDYWAWACTVALLFVDWPGVVDRFQRDRARVRGAPTPAG
jgi:hypothetical protein